MIDFTSWIKGSLEINLPEGRIWETSICWSRICLILHRGRGRVCIHWWGWWCKLSWPSTSRWSCRWSGRGQGTGGRNSAGHKNSQTGQRNFFIKALSLQCRSILPKQRPARKQCVWKACQGKWRYSSWAVRSNPRSCCGGWVHFELSYFFIDGKPEHEKENSGGGESEDGQEEGGEHPNLHLVLQICTYKVDIYIDIHFWTNK